MRSVTHRLSEPPAVPASHRVASLKAHLLDGSAVVFESWQADTAGSVIVGVGERFDPYRARMAGGELSVPIDSVVLFETTELRPSRAIAPLAIVSGVTVAVTLACLSNPKACFGSCPTFYVDDGGGPTLQAEGFSSSVAPSLEATDVDALYRVRHGGGELVVSMVNEALETHVVRHVDLLAARRPAGGRVLRTPDRRFLEVAGLQQPRVARSEEGDCLAALAAFDGTELVSRADSTDLLAREIVELEFDRPPAGPVGLVIAARQSLLTTFLFYQLLAYMGDQAGYWLASLERSGLLGTVAAFTAEGFAAIEVQVPDGAGGWHTVGSTGETGPLAADVTVVELPELPEGVASVRLQVTRGLWRLDCVALAALGGELEPERLSPSRVVRAGEDDSAALAALLDPEKVLVTFPGDTLDLHYPLAQGNGTWELFLESRGYYLEWLRSEWLAEQDPERVEELMTDPLGAMRRVTAQFKRAEPEIERAFWESRFVRP